MNYCEACRYATKSTVCPICAAENLRPVRRTDFCFLTEKEEMWAKLIIEILEDNHIPSAHLPVWGAALAMKGGRAERYQIFVPFEKLEEATDLLTIVSSQ